MTAGAIAAVQTTSPCSTFHVTGRFVFMTASSHEQCGIGIRNMACCAFEIGFETVEIDEAGIFACCAIFSGCSVLTCRPCRTFASNKTE